MGARLRRDTPLLKSRSIDVLHYREGRQKTRKIVIRCVSEAVFEALRTRLRGARSEANGGKEGVKGNDQA
jgi:hypothetical protein